MSKQKLEEVFHFHPDERVREETLSFHALNPFIINNSSPRGTMFSQHMSQQLTLMFGEEKIVQSGLDHQFGENTFSIKVEEDCYFLYAVERYRTIDRSEDPVEVIIFVQTVSGKYDCYRIPYYFSLHQYFGFKYEYSIEKIREFKTGDFFPAGTIFADSPSVRENSGYAYGVNAVIGLLTLPGGAEDGVIMSRSMADKMAYRIFESRSIEFGSNKFLLNLYGDDNDHKGFPEIGEKIGDDSILAVLRSHDDSMVHSLTSVNDMKKFEPMFDQCVYVKSPGTEYELQGKKYPSGRVVDIKAYCNPKARAAKHVYNKTLGTTLYHVERLKNFYKDILDVYENHIKKNAMSNNFRDKNTIKLSERLTKLIEESMVIADPYSKKIPLTNRSVPLDVYHIDFVVEHIVPLGIGHKISDSNGKISESNNTFIGMAAQI